MDIKEIAYHEAGHTIVGYFFYAPVTTTIKQSGKFLGSTNSDITCPLFFDSPQNELFFRLYLYYFLFVWSGEYFQRKISKDINEDGLERDKAFIEEFIQDRVTIDCFDLFKTEFLSFFFAPKITDEMVDDIANQLLEKETLTYEEIRIILSKYNFDPEIQINLLMDKYYLPFCKKYDEIKTQ